MGRKAKSKAKKRASSSASAASESSSLANSMVSSVAGDDERASLVEPLTEPEEEAGKADDVAVVAQEEAATEKVAVKTAVEEAAAAVEEAAVEVIEVAREETTVLLETETVTATSSVEEVAVAQQETAVEEIAFVADEETEEAATLITETVATTATSIEEHAIAVQETAVEEVVEVAHEETVKTTTLTTETVTTTEASVEEVAVVQLETAVEDFAVDAHEEAAFATDTVATFVVEEVGNGQEETAVEEVADEETTTSTVTSSHVEAHVEESVSTDIKAVSYAETVETATSKTEPLTSSVGSAVALEESVTELATVIAPEEATSFMTETVTTNNEAVASMEETTSEDVAFDAREETVETTTIKTETVVTTSSNLIHTAREEVPALNSEMSTVTTTEGVEEHSTLEAESVVSTTVETVELVETSRVEVEVASLVETEDVQEPSEVEVVVAAGVEDCQAVVHEDTAFSDDIQAKTEPLYIDESSETEVLTTPASEEATSASFAVEAVEDAAGVVEKHTDAAKLEVEEVVDVTKANAHTDASDTEIEDASVSVEFPSNGVTKEVLSSNTETSESVTDEVPEAGDAATFTREFVVEDKYQEEIITKSERFDEEEVTDSTSANAFVEETEVTIESQSDVETIVQQERADFQVAPTSLDVAAFYYRDSATNEPVTEIEAGTTVDAPEEPKSSGHRTEVTHVMTIDELEIGSAEDSTSIQYSDAVLNGASSNTEPAPLSQDKKTRSRPMLTTERSFVMEDDDTVKADDTVVVGERVSTDGEDDYEDLASHVTENLQSVAMSPVVEKRHLEEMHPTPTRKSSVTAPTASSLARRSSEDGSFSVTPTRSRSRSSSGSKYASPPSSTGFVKPPPAPPTVPVPPKRASIMAPTASSSAKQFGDDAVPSKAPSRARASSSEAKPSVSDTGFIKPPPPPPTVPVPPKRASIMAPTASYAAKLQTEEVKKPLTRLRPAPNAKPEISETGFVKPPPAAPTVPVPPKRASIMAPTASYAAKHQAEAPKKPAVRARASPNAKPEVSETGFVKPPPPPPTVPVAPKRASIMAPTASSAAKRGGSESRSDDSWARDAPPKPVSKPKGEFVPTVPVAPKRASIMAPTASFRAKSSPEVAVEDLSPPPEEPKQPLYRNKRYANVQSKVRGIINAPAKAHPEVKKPAPPPQETPAPVQKPTMFKSKRYANVQSKIKDIIHSGPAETNGEASVVNRRRSLGSVKRDSLADAVSRRSSLAGTSARHPGVARAEPNDAFARVLAERSHKKKLDNVVPRYLSYQNSGVYAQRAQVQHDRRRRLQEENSSKSQTRQQQLRVMFAERMHANFNPMDAAHTQAALGNVGAKARRVKTRGSRSSSQSGSASDEFSLSATSDSKAGPVAVAGGVIVIPSRDEETVVEEDVVVETTTATVEVATALSEVDDDGITKKINFDDTSDDEEEELESTTPVPVADVA